jgi:hypothetical protein
VCKDGVCGEGLGWASVQGAHGGTDVRHVNAGWAKRQVSEQLSSSTDNNGRLNGTDA